ncbi:unnamed protein product [Cladocopium goreaui]|uniref:Uncharacterized protein n=1 Tax=Cladocopium goreaui TaxID=2562237 RepID=A0A9P1BN81_9DINO|nr:unnamed protein product [Cladocopium goreaui]
MAKRIRSLASVLWDTDLEASDQEGYQIQEVDAVQKTRRLEKENADLLAEVTHLRQENTLLKIPKPRPTEPSQLCRTRPELLRTWPLQRWELKNRRAGMEAAPPATDVSTETPDKVLKKMRAEKPTEIEPPKPRRLYESPYYSPSPAKPGQLEGLQAPAYPGHLGETGESPDEVCALKAMNMQLEAEKAGLEQEVANLRKQLSDMTLNQPDEGDTQNEHTFPSTTDEAVRKMLQVPLEIHNEWKQGGASRARLQELFQQCNFDKATFINYVTVETEKRQSVKVKVKAQWASEDKMREVLKFSAARIKAVKDYCEKKGDHTKWDKYESKTLFWVEEEVEAEYESSRSKTTREQFNYETEQPAPDALLEAAAPLTLDMADVRDTPTGLPGQSGGSTDDQKRPTPTAPVLPQVQKNEKASQVILKYLDGTTKRIGKISELKVKYETIPQELKTATHDAFVNKLTSITDSLEKQQTSINEIYAEGAVEGYSVEAQESLSMEARSKSIPIPKAKSSAVPAGKAKAKAKVKAKAKPEPAPSQAAKAAPKRAAARQAKPGVMLKNLALSMADGAPATRLKRFALSAIEEAKQEGSHEVSAAIKKAGNMTVDNLKNAERDLHILFRKYGKLAEKVGKGICPECLAGLDDLPFEDVSWNPRWLPSEGLENPWDDDDVSPLLQIPGHTARQHEIFRKDPFHIFKQTVGGHWVASAIVLLSDLGYWSSPGQSNQADVLLEVAYQDFHHFMKDEWQGHHVANIKNFTRALLHWPKIRTFPYGRFKGSDCMLMIRWLAKVIQKGVLMKETNQRQGVSLLDRPLEAWHKPFLQNILLGSTASVEFFRILHTQGVWLSRETSRNLALHCYNFTNSYSGLARLCHGQGLRRFTLEPSLHYFHHYAVDVTARLQAQDSHILSPNQDNCEMDEDFVGRISRLSRAVHASTTTQRTLQRYLIKVWFVLTGQDWGASGSTKRKRKLTRTGGVKKRKHQNQVNNP